jgi:LacI family transcriptional regulator
MTDVAQIAGVSQSSVSLVLNRMTGARIADGTRERVLDAARRIGYIAPSERHENRTAHEPDTIAFVIDEISTSPHPVVNLDGVRDCAWESGYLVSTHVTRSNPELEAATLESINKDGRVLGIVYAAIFTREISAPRGLGELPTVLLNCYSKERRFSSIVPSEITGGYAATNYLIANGHRRIGFINGEPWMDASADRLKGYRQALATHDIAFDAKLLRNGDWLPLKGYQFALELLRLDPPPTAVFCANDLMAMGALEAAAELGLRVPEDISIMGYDDQELAGYTHPPLSTLVLPNYEMGRRAAELLIGLAISGNKRRAGVIKIDGPIVERGSVGARAVKE